jgi:imidazolonepropionase-like amidohydrolase
MITQTGGHGDFRFPFELPRGSTSPLSRTEVIGVSIVADGVPEVQRRVREKLALGASQIKLTAGGGVSSPGPIGITAFSDAELRAAVEAARNWGTYVNVHACSTASVQQAIAGVAPAIDHGTPDRRRHGEADGGEGVLVEPAALPRRRGPDPAARSRPERRG